MCRVKKSGSTKKCHCPPQTAPRRRAVATARVRSGVASKCCHIQVCVSCSRTGKQLQLSPPFTFKAFFGHAPLATRTKTKHNRQRTSFPMPMRLGRKTISGQLQCPAGAGTCDVTNSAVDLTNETWLEDLLCATELFGADEFF